jgi:hypothetical protein
MLALNSQVHSPARYLTDPSVAVASDSQPYFPIGNQSWSTGENIYAYSSFVNSTSLTAYVNYLYEGLMIDWGVPDFGHLLNIMAPGPAEATPSGHVPYSEVGIGLLTNARPTTTPAPNPANPRAAGMNVGPVIVTQEFAWRTGDANLTGVVFQDTNGDGQYSPTGEGLGGVTIKAIGLDGQGTYTTQTWSSGGYTLPLRPGAYTVTATGNVPYTQTETIVVGVDNVGWNLDYSTTQADVPVPVDYDGDGKTDLAVYRPSTGQWFIMRSSLGPEVISLGTFGGIPVPGNYDNTGAAEPAIYQPSTATWTILGPSGLRVVSFGEPDVDIPVPGDYDGDGRTDLAVYRPTTGQWLVLQSAAGPMAKSFGEAGVDIPVPGDYDGDGRTDLAVYRPTSGQWFIWRSTAGPLAFTLGTPGQDIPLAANYSGGGRAEPAVYRPSTSQWLILQPAGLVTTQFGPVGDEQPIVGDFDGDQRADIALFQPSTAQWFLMESSAGNRVVSFGEPGVGRAASLALSPSVASYNSSAPRIAAPGASNTSSNPPAAVSPAQPAAPSHAVNTPPVAHYARRKTVAQDRHKR